MHRTVRRHPVFRAPPAVDVIQNPPHLIDFRLLAGGDAGAEVADSLVGDRRLPAVISPAL